MGARSPACGGEAYRPWKASDRRPSTIRLVVDSEWRLIGAHGSQYVKNIILSTESAAKVEQKGANIGCRGSWSLREQQLELNMKALKLVSLHQTLREQRPRKKRLKALVYQNFSFSSLPIYRRQWHPHSTVLALRSTLHQKQHDTPKVSRSGIFWRYSRRRRPYLLPKSAYLSF